MTTVNKVMLCGNVTREPEIKFFDQKPIAKFGLALNRKYKDKEEVTFIDCSAFGKTAEIIQQYVKKGNLLFVEGRLKLEQWTDQNGGKKQALRVVVEGIQLMPQKQQQYGEEPPPVDYPDDTAPF